MSQFLSFYHHYIQHSFGGYGPWLLLIALWLLFVVPSSVAWAKLTPAIGDAEAERRTSPVAGVGLLLVMLLAWYFGTH